MNSKRGLIIIPRLILNGLDQCPYDVTSSLTARRISFGKEITIDLWIQPDDLRQYLLYWDLITIPTIKFGVGGAIAAPYLKDEELIKLNQYSVFNVVELAYSTDSDDYYRGLNDKVFFDLKEVYASAQDYLVNSMNLNSEILWSLGQTGSGLIRCSDHITLGSSIEFCFSNSLPIPSGDTEIEKILEFKGKREAELLKFRSKIDQLCEKVLKSENKNDEIKKAVEQINLSLIDIKKVLDESKVKRIMRDIKMCMDLKESALIKAIAAILGASGTMAIDLPTTYGALGGIALSGLFEMILKERKLNLPEHSKDFAYLYYVQKEI